MAKGWDLRDDWGWRLRGGDGWTRGAATDIRNLESGIDGSAVNKIR